MTASVLCQQDLPWPHSGPPLSGALFPRSSLTATTLGLTKVRRPQAGQPAACPSVSAARSVPAGSGSACPAGAARTVPRAPSFSFRRIRCGPPGAGTAAAVATDPETPLEVRGLAPHGEGKVSVESSGLARPSAGCPSVTRPCDHTLMSPCVWVSGLRNTCTQVTSGQDLPALVPTSQAGRPRRRSAQAEASCQAPGSAFQIHLKCPASALAQPWPLPGPVKQSPPPVPSPGPVASREKPKAGPASLLCSLRRAWWGSCPGPPHRPPGLSSVL